jgi:hypothetical protein
MDKKFSICYFVHFQFGPLTSTILPPQSFSSVGEYTEMDEHEENFVAKLGRLLLPLSFVLLFGSALKETERWKRRIKDFGST